tara:strand:+ start:1739 stop:2569 length:831 start_codon:yes stop_codon:yes gene_type:complete
MLRNIFIVIIIQSFIFCQIDEVSISIENRNSKKRTDQYLKKLKNDIEFYILSTDFLESPNENIKIALDISFIIESISDNNIISAHVLFSNRGDQILFSDGVDFEYNLGQTLIYTTTYNSLTSFINYNIFTIIAGELDKYNYKGGQNYYIRSEDIAYQASISDYPRRWSKRLKYLKQLKENIYFRNIKYLYQNIIKHLESTEDEFDEDIVIANLNKLYDELININDEYGYHKNTIHFLNSNLEEIAELYYDYEMDYVIKFLERYDRDNSEFYKDYID